MGGGAGLRRQLPARAERRQQQGVEGGVGWHDALRAAPPVPHNCCPGAAALDGRQQVVSRQQGRQHHQRISAQATLHHRPAAAAPWQCGGGSQVVAVCTASAAATAAQGRRRDARRRAAASPRQPAGVRQLRHAAKGQELAPQGPAVHSHHCDAASRADACQHLQARQRHHPHFGAARCCAGGRCAARTEGGRGGCGSGPSDTARRANREEGMEANSKSGTVRVGGGAGSRWTCTIAGRGHRDGAGSSARSLPRAAGDCKRARGWRPTPTRSCRRKRASNAVVKTGIQCRWRGQIRR